MKKPLKNEKIIKPINQLKLFGYKHYFDSFTKLYKRRKLSNIILLSGQKGIGKATFAFHFINYLLSTNENNKYLVDELKINQNNFSYNHVVKGIHPNFFLLQNDVSDENIKIDQVRNLLKFLSKSTFSENFKIVMIDNAEYLNINSSNALLKTLEEPNNNTFFFIIQNSSSNILDTIKSRCIEFKFFFNLEDKKEILKNIIKDYDLDFNLEDLADNFYFDSPGNLLNYLILFKNANIDIGKDKPSCIFHLIEKYKSKKDFELLPIISLFIEQYYNDLSINNINNVNHYFADKNKIINEISNMKKFNLDKKNLLISLKGIFENEAR
tara:strand:- start:318 stop:1292 length:975 start_codon:yes stop_codon:yes gene_type:complete